jgi:ribonuclease BN (tRNA processing enzyme)
MRLTIAGSGDAFGSGGRFQTCLLLETAKATLMVDCGASSPVALNVRNVRFGDVDAVILSHLHGDHFGGLPFLLVDAQLGSRRDRPLTIAGPPGTAARLTAALEVFFPGATQKEWRFPFQIVEIEPGQPVDLLGHRIETTEVVHRSGAPSTALRIADGARVFAYSGDTEWTEALVPVAAGADLFVVECYSHTVNIPGHLCWDILRARLPDLTARRIVVTHMSPAMLAHVGDIRAAGLTAAEDGLTITF